jgi:tetratricopeptide (TPR) repeat protein
MSPSYVSLIESGKRVPTHELLEVLARRLDTTPEDLIPPEQRQRSGERIELDLRWAKIAIKAGDAASADKYATAVLADPSCANRQRYEALLISAEAAEVRGDLDAAIDILEPLVDEVDTEETRDVWRACQIMLCRCYKASGDLGHAIDLGERAMAHDEAPSDEQVMLVISLAGAYLRRGDLKRAGRLLDATMARLDVVGTHRNQGAALWNASIVAHAEGRLGEAIRLSERALALFSESDAVRNLGRLRVTYATLLREQSTEGIPVAREQLRKAQLEFEQEGTVEERARCLCVLARCALDEDDVDAASALVVKAASMVGEGPDIERAHVELLRGHVLVRSGDVRKGLSLAQQAAAQLQDHLDSPYEIATAWREVAELAKVAGEPGVVQFALERSVDAMGVRPARVRRGIPKRNRQNDPQPGSLAGMIELALSGG